MPLKNNTCLLFMYKKIMSFAWEARAICFHFWHSSPSRQFGAWNFCKALHLGDKWQKSGNIAHVSRPTFLSYWETHRTQYKTNSNGCDCSIQHIILLVQYIFQLYHFFNCFFYMEFCYKLFLSTRLNFITIL